MHLFLLELPDIHIEDHATAEQLMEIIHARRSTHPRWYVPFRIRRLRCGAHGAERYPSNLLQWQTVYCVNDERHPIQDDFHPGREDDPSA
jgi:hypothetical protein